MAAVARSLNSLNVIDLRNQRFIGRKALAVFIVDPLLKKGFRQDEIYDMSDRMMRSWNSTGLSMADMEKLYVLGLAKGLESKDVERSFFRKLIQAGKENDEDTAKSDDMTITARLTTEFFIESDRVKIILNHLDKAKKFAGEIGFSSDDESGCDLLQGLLAASATGKRFIRQSLLPAPPMPVFSSGNNGTSSLSTTKDGEEGEIVTQVVANGRGALQVTPMVMVVNNNVTVDSHARIRTNNIFEATIDGYAKMENNFAWKLKEHHDKHYIKEPPLSKETANERAAHICKILKAKFKYKDLIKLFYTHSPIDEGAAATTTQNHDFEKSLFGAIKEAPINPKELQKIVELTGWFFRYARKKNVLG